MRIEKLMQEIEIEFKNAKNEHEYEKIYSAVSDWVEEFNLSDGWEDKIRKLKGY